MKRRGALTTVGVGVLSLGLFAGTAMAAEEPAPSPAPGTGTAPADGTGYGASNGRGAGRGGAGLGMGMGNGQRGGQQAGSPAGPGSGDCDQATYASGTLTDDQRAELVFMVQEEKLALDLYTAFGAEHDVRPFTRIAGAEARHMDAVRTLLGTYGIDDPTIGLDAGEFVDPALTSMYDTLLAQGMTSVDQALAVGRAVEADDVAALGEAAAGLTAEDVAHVYARLLAGSERHLTAFGG